MLKGEKTMESKQLAIAIALAMDKKKAQEIRAVQVDDLTVLADYFVMATGNSTTQVSAIADEVEFQLAQQDIRPLHIEGHDSKRWILMDYGDVIVHVFTPDAREFYDLEHLWADGKPLPLADAINAQRETEA